MLVAEDEKRYRAIAKAQTDRQFMSGVWASLKAVHVRIED
jgi:hypothetical protein